MSSIEMLKSEHVALRLVTDELGRLTSGDAPVDPAALAACRWKLARLVIQHLANEDRQIYGRRYNPKSPLGSSAKRLKEELGGLQASFQQHITRWTGQAVLADWRGYQADTRKLIDTLHHRIGREERELYPLVEAEARGAQKAA